MKKKTSIIINSIRLIIVIIPVSVIINTIYQIRKNNAEMTAFGLSGIKNDITIDTPTEYINLFKKSVRKSIKYHSTRTPIDSSYFPITTLKINDQYAKIYKFNSSLSINKILKIKKEKTKINLSIWYDEDNYEDIIVYTAKTSLKKIIENIELIIKGEINKIYETQNVYLFNGKLKTISLRFSKEYNINSVFIEENKFFKLPEYSLCLIKKHNSIYIIFFTSTKITKKQFLELIDI